jgi:hypothetical protein
MPIPKEYDRNANPPTLMNPWDHQVAAEIKARFGLDKPRGPFDVLKYARAAAEVVQDHGTELSFEGLKYQVGELAHARTHDGASHLVISAARNADGSIHVGEVIVGHGVTAAFCKAVKSLIESGTIEAFMPRCAMRFYPNDDAPKLDGLTVRVVKGPPPEVEASE